MNWIGSGYKLPLYFLYFHCVFGFVYILLFSLFVIWGWFCSSCILYLLYVMHCFCIIIPCVFHRWLFSVGFIWTIWTFVMGHTWMGAILTPHLCATATSVVFHLNLNWWAAPRWLANLSTIRVFNALDPIVLILWRRQLSLSETSVWLSH